MEGEIFLTCTDRFWGPPRFLYNRYRGFPGDKAAGAWRWSPIPSSVEVKERVELYLYSPCGPSRPVPGRTLPLPFTSRYKKVGSFLNGERFPLFYGVRTFITVFIKACR